MVQFEAAHSGSKGEASDANGGFASHALDGFLESGLNAVTHPVDTAFTVTSGVLVGTGLQTLLNNTECFGGRVGAVAKVGKIALLVAPVAYSALHIATSSDPGKETGKMLFEGGLFLGAAKLGTMVDRIPDFGKAFGPQQLTELPKGLNGESEIKFQVFGNKVAVVAPHHIESELPYQVRLTNGKGFYITGAGKTNLLDMPRQIKDVGSFEYGPRSTTLVNEFGSFTRNLIPGIDKPSGLVTSKIDEGSWLVAGEGKAYSISRPGRSEVSFRTDGHISAREGTYQSGRQWEFSPNGDISMRSLPAGKDQLRVAADSDYATHTYKAGSSRSIQGRVRGTNHLPQNETITSLPVDRTLGTIGEFQIPDITPADSRQVDALLNAKVVLDNLAANKFP